MAKMTQAQRAELVAEVAAAVAANPAPTASATETDKTAKKPVQRLSESAAARLFRALKAKPGGLRAHMRAQFLPWKALGALLGAGALQEALTTVSAVSVLSVALGSALSAWAGLAWLRTARARRAERTRLMAEWVADQPGHARLIAVAAWTWAVVLHLIGPDDAARWSQMALLALAGALALGARWWQHHRPVRSTPDRAPQAPEPPGEHPIARKWRTRVAAAGGVLAKSRLADLADEGYGVAGTLHLVGGKQDLDMVRANTSKIATALGIGAENLMFERIGATKEEPNPDPAVVSFKAVTASAVVEAVPLQGRRYVAEADLGRVRLGPYADGQGEAFWRLYSQDSMWGGYVVGSVGSGKSGMLDALALAAWESANTVVFYIDGAKDGGSSPRIFERATWALGEQPEQWEAMAQALETLVSVRGAENRRRLGTSGFTPSPERPGVLVILDESHKIVTNKTAKRWGNIVRQGRSSGVAVVMASQIFGLESFGGDDAVRSSICKGNTVALQIGRNQAGIMDFPLNPSKLPKDVPGLGLIDMGREATFRAAYAGGADMAARMEDAVQGAAVLDPLAQGALDMGSDGAFGRRDEIREAADADLDAMLAAAESGTVPAYTPARAAAGGSNAAEPALAPPELDPELLEGVDLSVLASEPRRWSGVHALVLEALETGPVRRGDIETAVMDTEGVSRATVSRALDTLANAAEIGPVPGRRGLWQRL